MRDLSAFRPAPVLEVTGDIDGFRLYCDSAPVRAYPTSAQAHAALNAAREARHEALAMLAAALAPSPLGSRP